ncbi:MULTISPECIES: hypothetical protein [Halobacteriovorax]|uniref:DUF3829 domain-containing protein n=1 Tax=Halobacteriovorax vibrionivorans TaxID=2152716 RepID=A0ABY0IEX9_9BACT|nr:MULTISPECIES: hypothetical protein [Halobacteriovorax]RZF20371.1 hypothetical protein DAY19_14505 [Halobacteriovorax vibrionivorans]TGD46544.1 hypothetical protein EP118_11265 [Halobacteriovorax sp. Y22]
MKKLLLMCAMTMCFVSCSKVKDKIKQIENNLETTAQGARSGMASGARDNQMEKVRDPKIDIAGKITAAAKFYKALEFNSWNPGTSYDDSFSRREMLLDASKEFIRNLTDIYSQVEDKIEDGKLTPIHLDWSKPKKFEKYNYDKAFYAMAVAMHEKHFLQEKNASKNKFTAVSFYDILKSTLKREYAGANLTEAERELMTYSNRKMIIALLNARIDMILALAIKDSMDSSDVKIMSAGLYLMTGKLGKLAFPSILEKSTLTNKQKTNEKYEEALSTYDFMLEIGERPEIDKRVKNILDNVILPELTYEQESDGEVQKYHGYLEQFQKM